MARKRIYKRTFWIRKESDDYWAIGILTQYYDSTYRREIYGCNGGECYYVDDKIKRIGDEYMVWDNYYGEWVYTSEPTEYFRHNGFRRMPEITSGLYTPIDYFEECKDTDLYEGW